MADATDTAGTANATATATPAPRLPRRHLRLVTRRAAAVIALCLASPSVSASQSDIGSPAGLLQDAAVRTALEAVRASEPGTLADQARICEIPAPPFGEQARAEAYARMFREVGLRNVRLDGEGNVLGERPGGAARPHVVVSAHLDTVFPEGTNVAVTRTGRVLRGPGIGDDCRGLAVLLSVARALDVAGIQTPGTITFVGTVGEEGLGDLRGVKALFNDTLRGRVDRFVSIDGGGYAITHIGIGSRRLRVAFTGPGGHSYSDFGRANPAHALGRALAGIAEIRVPRDTRSTFSVGRLGGGTSVNAIPTEAWMEVDLRSGVATSLDGLEQAVRQATERALAAENERWSQNGRLSLSLTPIGERPAGRTPESSVTVRVARAVTESLRLPLFLEAGSTDANLPMSLGIEAIAVGGGGIGTGAHTEAEAFDPLDSWRGTQRALLLTIGLAR